MTGLDPQGASVLAVASGARVAGLVICLGYLLGFVDGPLVIVVGALGLITYSRALLLDRSGTLLLCCGLGVVAAALGVGALRWGTLQLGDLRGVQAVLGPTLLVGPEPAAGASSVAAVAAILGTGMWLLPRAEAARPALVWSLLEAGVAALAVATVYFDPAEQALSGGAGRVLLQLGRWAAVVAVAAGLALAASIGVRRGPSWLRWAVVAVAGAGVAASGAIVTGTL